MTSLTVVRVVGVDGPGAVELLDQQHAGQRVGQGHVGQADAFVRGLPKCRLQAIGATDDQGNVIALKLPRLLALGQGLGGEAGATFVQRYHARATRCT